MRMGFALVRGRSMLPTLVEGDRLLVRYGATASPGDLVVVRFPDGVVAVKRVDTVGAEGCLVSRDNPAEGRDSWSLGGVPVPPADVLAKVLARVWPRPRLRLRKPR